MLQAAERLTDLRVPPGNRLHQLERDRAGQHSISINDQWRILDPLSPLATLRWTIPKYPSKFGLCRANCFPNLPTKRPGGSPTRAFLFSERMYEHASARC